MDRRYVIRGLAASSGALAAPSLRRSAFADEVKSIVLMKQHGLPYVPLMVMEKLRLVEKHAAKAGLADVKPEYKTLGGTASLMDALLAGAMHFGVTGIPSVSTLWAKTAGTPSEVRALCAVQSMPFYLVTHKANIKSIADFTETDKIALPAVKVAAQAICLQMAAAKLWGIENYAKLDPLTISRAHPDSATAIMSKSTEITGHYTASPFYQLELADKSNHSVLRSYDTFGGSKTNGILLMTKAFHDANPKVTAAVYAALTEANEFINKEPRQSAEFYAQIVNEKKLTVAQLTDYIADPENIWTTTPERAMQFADFMHKTGAIKRVPSSWKDLFMPEAHDLKGS